MKKKSTFLLTLLLFSFGVFYGISAEQNKFRYHTPREINKILKILRDGNKGLIKLHLLTKSPGGNPLYMVEISPNNGNGEKTPAIFVVANLSGTNLIASEAALFLVKKLVSKKSYRNDLKWFVLPVGNPDSALRYFKKPLYLDNRNSKLHNDDMDDAVDEDGFDDLNGDGLITMMRVRDPQGKYIPVPGKDPLMKKADPLKNEKGMYKIYTEGLDNDGDGKYNEDPPGGTDVSINFPHLFKHFTKTGGMWPGSTNEVYNLFKFIFNHKEIAMTIVFGETNFCMIPPKGGRKGSVDYDKIKIPKRVGKFFNVDTDKTYSMKEIMEMVKKVVPSGMEVTESMVASFLGLGAVVNPIKNDLKYYEKISKDFKEFLKKNKLDKKRLEPESAKDGSFELWSYYHLGLPSFSMDFWTLPEIKKKKEKGGSITPEKLEKMSKDEFLALGKEKIGAFLKSAGAPKNIKADFVINAVKNGMMTPKKMAGFMKKMKKKKDSGGIDPRENALYEFAKNRKFRGYVKWTKFMHPDLGEVEIGGEVPFASKLPPATMAMELIKKQVPYVFKLSSRIAKIGIGKTAVKNLGKGFYRIEAWIENRGFLPFPTAMGAKNARITPVIVKLKGKGIKIYEGKKRTPVKEIKGLNSKKVSWLIYSKKPGKIILESITDNACNESIEVNLGGKK